ncbi:MAG: hypothetical protein RL641_713 [Candidatus Parcubacteria bacterium]|jgi:sugar-specific transcriptional regulator TrmB
MNIQPLINFGLSEKEARVYTELLELGSATANIIAKKTGINRSSMYVILESLKTRGLISTSNDSSVQSYIPSHPDTLLQIAETEARRQDDNVKNIRVLTNKLKSLISKNSISPTVRVFEGKQGVINTFENSLASKEKVMRIYSSVKEFAEMLPDYLPEYQKKRWSIGLRMKGIHEDNEITRMLSSLDKKGFDSPILVPKDSYTFPADLAIYDDSIGYMSSKNGGFGIVRGI